MSKKLSKYKFKRIATESFKNGLRLHFDSIILYKNESFPSSFQLSVLAMEELAKSNWVEHYYWSSNTNNNWPDEDFEQKWLKLLYIHPKKQKAFLDEWGSFYDYSPKFVAFVKKKRLELKKQRATYVGLDRSKGKINVDSRISVPTRIKDKDAREMISMLNDFLIEICETKLLREFYFDIEEKDELLNKGLLEHLRKWKFRSGVKSKRWYKEWIKRLR